MFRTILAHLDGRPCGARTLEFAGLIAGKFASHLAAVFAAPTPFVLASAVDPAVAAALNYQVETARALRSAAEAQVAAARTSSGLAIELRATLTGAIDDLASQARHADLLVMSQDDPGLPVASGRSVAAGVIMRSGRPVLLVPSVGTFETCGDSVLIAWNASREAARAVADALPLLKAARAVNVVSLSADEDSNPGSIPGAEIGLWLARHDVRTTLRERRAPEGDIGDNLLWLAAKLGADLLVMGAYGHSRACEMVLGGATRRILGRMTLPVLMSH